MAFTFDATVSGTTSNSYATVAEANDYFDGRYENSLWPTTTADIERLLVTATQRLDAEDYSGIVSSDAQRLQWPRDAVFNRNGYAYSKTEMPQNLINAVCEMAYWLLQQDERIMSEVELHDAAMMKANSIGPISQQYGKVEANKLPASVTKELESIGPKVWLGNRKATVLFR